jgi:translocation and assembly module TamB
MPGLPEGMQGQLELHASMKGPLKDKSRMEAHLQIPALNAAYQQLQIRNVRPIRVNYAHSVIAVEPGEISGTETSLYFQGQVPLDTTSPMTFTAQGRVDLRLLNMFSPDLHSSGVVAVDLRSAGNTSHPSVGGQIHIQDVGLATSSAPIGVEKLNGTLELANDRVQIRQMTGEVGGGQVSAGGFVAYRPQLQMNLALKAKSLRLRYPEGMRAVLDSDLSLTGTAQASTLDGRVLIDGLGFTQDFDISTFMNQFTGESAPPTGQSFADNLKLNIAVQSAAQLAAVSSTVSLEGQANLRIVGTASNPVVVGRTDLTAGEIFFRKQRYQLVRGIINFTNPNQTTPDVNVLITTVINQYNLSITIVGPIDKLRTDYVSDPPLPPIDVINLIARGKTTEEQSAGPTGLGADTVLAEQAAASYGANAGVQKLTGISGLQVDPLFGGENQNPSARVGFQQRVSKNLLFNFSTDVTSAQREVFQGEYQISKRWSISATRDESGGVAMEGKFRTNF